MKRILMYHQLGVCLLQGTRPLRKKRTRGDGVRLVAQTRRDLAAEGARIRPATPATSASTATKEERETLGTLHRQLTQLQALAAERQEQTKKPRLRPTPKNKAKQFDAKKELQETKAKATEAAEREIQEHDGMMDGDIQNRIEFFRERAAMFQGAVWRAQDIFFISKTMALVAYESYVSYVS